MFTKKSVLECEIDICFRAADDGTQSNPCRDLLTAYVADPNMRTGRAIASRLAENTDRRSGLGLLFLLCGKEGHNHRLLLSRFPTEQAILAEENSDALDVRFLEQVFLKNKHSYKAVVYEDASLTGGFWEGTAIDKQNPDFGGSFSSNYWIGDFLCSELSTTPAAGTRRLGQALKDAARKSQLSVKREIMAAVTLATGLRGQRISISGFEDRYNLSQEARDAIEKELKVATARAESFLFDVGEFQSTVGYRSVELDNGGVMTALAGTFDQVFRARRIDRSGDEIQFTTQGKIVEEKLKRST